MKVLTCSAPYNLEYSERPEPLAKKGNTLIRIQRIGICGTDLHAFEGTQPYFTYPRVLGHELAGIVVKTEADSGFEKGESVTVIPYFNCGLCVACRNGKPNCCVDLRVAGVHVDGGMTDLLSVPNYSLVHGDGLTCDELALVEPLAIGAHAVQRAGVGPGDDVLVIGAGPIGLATMEFARIAGARVIALDTNAHRLSFCETRLKIHCTFNAEKDDVPASLKEATNGDMPTIVIDATGNLGAIEKGFSFIRHGGRYILVGLQKEEIKFSHPEFHKRETTLMSSRNATRADFVQVMNAIKSKLVDPTAYVTHRVRFDEVAEAFPDWLKPQSGVIKVMVSA